MLRVCSLVLFGVVVLGGCVPLNMHGALREAYDRAEADHQAINNELARALAENAGLQREAGSLKAALESMTRQARDLDAQLQQTSRGRAALAEQAVTARMSAVGYADSPRTLAHEPAWARRVEIILRYQ